MGWFTAHRRGLVRDSGCSRRAKGVWGHADDLVAVGSSQVVVPDEATLLVGATPGSVTTEIIVLWPGEPRRGQGFDCYWRSPWDLDALAIGDQEMDLGTDRESRGSVHRDPERAGPWIRSLDWGRGQSSHRRPGDRCQDVDSTRQPGRLFGMDSGPGSTVFDRGVKEALHEVEPDATSVAGMATVESKGELVEVKGKMSVVDRSTMDLAQPTIESLSHGVASDQRSMGPRIGQAEAVGTVAVGGGDESSRHAA